MSSDVVLNVGVLKTTVRGTYSYIFQLADPLSKATYNKFQP